MPLTIVDGGDAPKDALETLLYTFDYDVRSNLAPGAQLASVGTFTITPSGVSQASASLVSGNRGAQVLLGGGVRGQVYEVRHTVSTNESPAQVKSKTFKLRIT